jgi:hypothetical protein
MLLGSGTAVAVARVQERAKAFFLIISSCRFFIDE